MLSMSLTRNRRSERDTKLHQKAIRKALERKADREFAKANPDILTEEEELEEVQHQQQQKVPSKDEFFDVCNEKDKKAKKKASKKAIKTEETKPSKCWWPNFRKVCRIHKVKI